MKPVRDERQVIIRTPLVRLPQGEALGIAGSCPALGAWSKTVVMEKGYSPYAKAVVSASEPFEYKFVVVEEATGRILRWEDGWNRSTGDFPVLKRASARTSEIRITASPAHLPEPKWKGAGTAIPLFSLRTHDSFGIGDFADLKKMADWAALTGQKIIQLLPLNDTTMTGTCQDSYPYNANSTFALHPQFISLKEAGLPETEEYTALQQELNALDKVDYERVNEAKTRLLKEFFHKERRKIVARKGYKAFVDANGLWLLPYAAFQVLTEINGTADFTKWKTNSKYKEAEVQDFCQQNKEAVEFHIWEQYLLATQLDEARQYAHGKGVMVKGDLPIGISRTSVDAWQFPKLFNMDSSAGAPPDAFSATGQNWGFPTYNWDRMSKDGYAWWKARLKKMAECFDAFRIDHILGFFRIWEIPLWAQSGLMGHFSPALPYSADELAQKGFWVGDGQYVTPNEAQEDVLFLEDPPRKGYYHPRIGAQFTNTFRSLDDWHQRAFNELYNDFFYHRHNAFWKESAYRKLPELLGTTDMMACGEDLGMIPDCVPEAMGEMQILSLEIQRMPKDPTVDFADTTRYPYLSVCATSTHDMNPIRAWWEEDREVTAKFWYGVLGGGGEVPYFCEPWICERIVNQHLASPSMLAVLPLQDWLAIDGELRLEDPREERINVPAIPRYYWRYRMHLTIEDLLVADGFNSRLRNLIQSSGR